MSNIVPFDFSAPAPQVRAARRPGSINAEIMTGGAGYPVLHIKGKVFSVTKDGERRMLTRMIDDEEIPVASLNLTVVRANHKSRVFYAKSYSEGDSEGAKPTCFSHDGIRPDATVETPQATSCAACPNAVWGSKVSTDGQGGKGTACAVNTRLAVMDPKAPDTMYLLRAPAASRGPFQEAVKIADSHGKDYNEVVMKISFDVELSTPKLLFKPNGLLSDELYAKVQEHYDSPTVLDIVGTPTVRMAEEVTQARPALPVSAPAPALAAPRKPAPLVVDEDDIDLALSGAAAPQPAPAPKPRPPAAKKVAAPAPAPADAGGLLSELDSLLGATDD